LLVGSLERTTIKKESQFTDICGCAFRLRDSHSNARGCATTGVRAASGWIAGQGTPPPEAAADRRTSNPTNDAGSQCGHSSRTKARRRAEPMFVSWQLSSVSYFSERPIGCEPGGLLALKIIERSRVYRSAKPVSRNRIKYRAALGHDRCRDLGRWLQWPAGPDNMPNPYRDRRTAPRSEDRYGSYAAGSHRPGR